VRVPVNESIGHTPPPPTSLPIGPLSFDLDSLDERSVSAPALRGKPLVLVFLVSDTLAGQAEADILVGLAQREPDAARYAIVAVEPRERRELVLGFIRFFTDKTHAAVLGAMADRDMLLGQGPFGDVRGLTVVVLDPGGRVVFRRSGLVKAIEIAHALAAM
jgi:hypothetical protein